MSVLRAGSNPALSCCALAALTALAGCSAAGSTHPYSAQDVPVAAKVAHATVAVEDDGLPPQAPPSGRIRHAPDDPSEPFSKNYGGGNPAVLNTKERAGASPEDHAPAAPSVPVPKDLPPDFRRKLMTALAQDE